MVQEVDMSNSNKRKMLRPIKGKVQMWLVVV